MTRLEDARRGSEKLRDAILASMGLVTPEKQKKARRHVSGVWWTKEDHATLCRLAKAKLNSVMIGAILGRSPCAIRSQAWKLGVSLDYRKIRYSPKPADISQWTEADKIAEWAKVPQPLAELVVVMCKECGVTVSDARGHKRTPALINCRKKICTTAREAGYSLPAIARATNRDHTTVLHHVRTGLSAFSTGYSKESRFVPCAAEDKIAA